VEGFTTIFVLSSIHHVLSGEKILKAAGAAFDLIPVPKEVNPDCGMAIEAMPGSEVAVLDALTEAGLVIEAVYRREGRRFERLSPETGG